MTDPTNLRAALTEALDLYGGLYAEHNTLRERAGLGLLPGNQKIIALRDMLRALPPACDCDGGLFGAGPGDHAIGCPARPVERRPVAGWCDGILILGDPGDKDMRCAVGGSDAQGWWWCAPNTDGIVEGCPTVDAAKLAAEDAAADLMRAGLAVLGRVK